jgi:hypothetical protein
MKTSGMATNRRLGKTWKCGVWNLRFDVQTVGDGVKATAQDDGQRGSQPRATANPTRRTVDQPIHGSAMAAHAEVSLCVKIGIAIFNSIERGGSYEREKTSSTCCNLPRHFYSALV